MTSQQENNQSMIKYFYTISFKTTSELSVIRFLTVDCIKTQPNLKLTQHQVQQIMEAQRIYNSWEIQDEQKLFKTYKFSSQREMDSFMNQTIDLLQQIHYQPIISMEGKKVRIELSNEEINGISVKDLLVAFALDNSSFDARTGDKSCLERLISQWNQNYSNAQDAIQKHLLVNL